MQKIRIEGFSRESMEAALADAMSRASVYLSERFDVNLQLLELSFLPGRGYKAVIEVTIIPMGDKDTLKVKPLDVEVRQEHRSAFRKSDKDHEKKLKQLISDHFANTVREYLPDIPDYFLSDFDQVRLLNYEIEKAFFRASHNIHDDIPPIPDNVPHFSQVLGRRPENDEDPEPEPE